METIFENLQNPSWWFDRVFIVGLLYALKKIFEHTPSYVKKFFKGRRLKRLRLIRQLRHSQASITYETIRTHAYFVVFLFVCSVYLFGYTSTSMTGLLKTNLLAFAILCTPIYIVEFLWLFRNDFSQELVKEHNKLLRYARKRG